MASGATTIWGRPYPLSTDAPAVHTDIQALANSLETTPLFPTTAVSSRTGVAGESVAVSPSQTLTLPASPVKGDRVQILALGTVTGATPATVAGGGGKVINGLGLSAASSFVLGAPNAYATVQYDGTAWRVIDGQQDTGWVDLSVATNVVLNEPRNPQYRLAADRVWLRGGASTNSSFALNSILNTLPAIIRPSSSVLFASGLVATTGTGPGGYVEVQSTGATLMFTSTGGSIGASSQYFLDSVSWALG